MRKTMARSSLLCACLLAGPPGGSFCPAPSINFKGGRDGARARGKVALAEIRRGGGY